MVDLRLINRLLEIIESDTNCEQTSEGTFEWELSPDYCIGLECKQLNFSGDEWEFTITLDTDCGYNIYLVNSKEEIIFKRLLYRWEALMEKHSPVGKLLEILKDK